MGWQEVVVLLWAVNICAVWYVAGRKDCTPWLWATIAALLWVLPLLALLTLPDAESGEASARGGDRSESELNAALAAAHLMRSVSGGWRSASDEPSVHPYDLPEELVAVVVASADALTALFHQFASSRTGGGGESTDGFVLHERAVGLVRELSFVFDDTAARRGPSALINTTQAAVLAATAVTLGLILDGRWRTEARRAIGPEDAAKVVDAARLAATSMRSASASWSRASDKPARSRDLPADTVAGVVAAADLLAAGFDVLAARSSVGEGLAPTDRVALQLAFTFEDASARGGIDAVSATANAAALAGGITPSVAATIISRAANKV